MTFRNIEKVNSFEDLIDKIEKEEFLPGFYAVVSSWFHDFRAKGGDDNYYRLVGFVHCMQAFGIISVSEGNMLIDNLIYINGYHFDDDGNEFWVDEKGKRHYTRDEG